MGLICPFAGFDILKHNFCELSYPNLLTRVYYSTISRANQSALDYRFTLNKFVADTDEWLRRSRSAEDHRAEFFTIWFINRWPDPSLATSFQPKA